MIQRPPGGVGPGRPFSAILSTQGVDQREVAPQRCRALCFGISISPLRPKRTGEGRRGPYAAPLAIFFGCAKRGCPLTAAPTAGAESKPDSEQLAPAVRRLDGSPTTPSALIPNFGCTQLQRRSQRQIPRAVIGPKLMSRTQYGPADARRRLMRYRLAHDFWAAAPTWEEEEFVSIA